MRYFPPCGAHQLLLVVLWQITHLNVAGNSFYQILSVDGLYFLLSRSCARNLDQLGSLKITHIVNAARGAKDQWHVNISPIYYKKLNISVLGIEATDTPKCQIHPNFEKATNFIANALESGGIVILTAVFWETIC